VRKTNEKTKRTIYNCDRCGKKFAESYPGEATDPADTSVRRGSRLSMPVVVRNKIHFELADLCGPCTLSLSKWYTPKKSVAQ
jgi:hypothetical protein